MAVTCSRCGRSDGIHVGFHDDAELPIKRGDSVRLRAGAPVRTTHPTRRCITNKRTRTVTVLSIDCGQSRCIGYDDAGNQIWQHISDPGIRWAGTGGYWHTADLIDVEALP